MYAIVIQCVLLLCSEHIIHHCDMMCVYINFVMQCEYIRYHDAVCVHILYAMLCSVYFDSICVHTCTLL